MPVFAPPRVNVLRPASGLVPALALVLALVLLQRTPAPARGQGLDPSARQVTLFGVIASPFDPAVDPKLAKIAPQLRKVLPNHGFKLLAVQSKRLTAGQTVTCPLDDGFTAAATLNVPADENGKVQLRCAVLLNQAVQLESLVTTPPNQLFFCEKALPNGTRLLVGIGAR
jgi:hypothetical protein